MIVGKQHAGGNASTTLSGIYIATRQVVSLPAPNSHLSENYGIDYLKSRLTAFTRTSPTKAGNSGTVLDIPAQEKCSPAIFCFANLFKKRCCQ